MKKVLVFGSSYMAEEYLKVLKYLNCEVIVISRDAKKASDLAKKYGFQGYGGSVSKLKEIDCSQINLAIIASSIESLGGITLACIEEGIKNILVEKPGALSLSELLKIKKAMTKETNLRIAYNRRFYSSVIKLRELIEKEGILGCLFDFTDREKDVLLSNKSPEVIKKWGFANSSHVIDTAFFLTGEPEIIHCERAGSFEKHPTGNTFTGSGKTQKCLFSYFATWSGGGRWNIEISTPRGRYKLSPLEELKFCLKNQFNWENIEIEDAEDKQFKPGLLKMTSAMLNKSDSMNLLPNLDRQIETCKTINKIFGYGD